MIEEVIGPVNYCIRSTAPNSRPSVVHKNRLKMCYSSKIAEEEPAEEASVNVPANAASEPTAVIPPKVKRGRGRPKKASNTVAAPRKDTELATTAKRKPGRPRKVPAPQVAQETSNVYDDETEAVSLQEHELEAIEELDEPEDNTTPQNNEPTEAEEPHTESSLAEESEQPNENAKNPSEFK